MSALAAGPRDPARSRDVPASATRIYALVARSARKAVVFRRGPSKHVATLGWDLTRDTFEVGQWFKGRIYERRCDLSPSGALLVYFAADFRPGPGSWTAVSRAPYLKALQMWPKGDTWGGGGLFDSESSLALNHAAQECEPAPGQTPLRGLRVSPMGTRPGPGGGDAVEGARRAREGWQRVRAAKWLGHEFGGKIAFPVEPGAEQIIEKPQPQRARPRTDPGRRAKPRVPVSLEELLHGVGERDGSWYITEYRLVHRTRAAMVSLGRTDWADWDHTGDLLFAREGRLYRLAAASAQRLAVADARELLDLRPLRFEAKAAPY